MFVGPSVFPRMLRRLLPERFVQNSMFGIFTKLCRLIPTSVKIGRNRTKWQTHHMKMHVTTLWFPPFLVSISGRTVFSVRYSLRLKKQLNIKRDGLKTVLWSIAFKKISILRPDSSAYVDSMMARCKSVQKIRKNLVVFIRVLFSSLECIHKMGKRSISVNLCTNLLLFFS